MVTSTPSSNPSNEPGRSTTHLSAVQDMRPSHAPRLGGVGPGGSMRRRFGAVHGRSSDDRHCAVRCPVAGRDAPTGAVCLAGEGSGAYASACGDRRKDGSCRTARGWHIRSLSGLPPAHEINGVGLANRIRRVASAYGAHPNLSGTSGIAGRMPTRPQTFLPSLLRRAEEGVRVVRMLAHHVQVQVEAQTGSVRQREMAIPRVDRRMPGHQILGPVGHREPISLVSSSRAAVVGSSHQYRTSGAMRRATRGLSPGIKRQWTTMRILNSFPSRSRSAARMA